MEKENGALAEKVRMLKEIADFTSNGMVVQGQEIDTLHEAVGVLENALIARDANSTSSWYCAREHPEHTTVARDRPGKGSNY